MIRETYCEDCKWSRGARCYYRIMHELPDLSQHWRQTDLYPKAELKKTSVCSKKEVLTQTTVLQDLLLNA